MGIIKKALGYLFSATGFLTLMFYLSFFMWVDHTFFDENTLKSMEASLNMSIFIVGLAIIYYLDTREN